MSSVPLNFRLSNGVLGTISPPIPEAYKWSTQYTPSSSNYEVLIDMSQGVPGTPPHPLLIKAIVDAAALPNAFGYCPAEGEKSLREALVKEMKEIYGKGGKELEELDLDEGDVAITAGCNLAFVAAVMSVADAGDEVILPVPWYFNHQMTLSLLGIKTIQLETLASDGFLPSVERCKPLITPKTRAIALVTPNNPTGAIYPPSLLAAFASLAHSNNIALIIDETYRDFILSAEPPHNLFSKSSPYPWQSNLVSLYSFSKSYRIPGYRLGAITASPHLLNHIKTILDTLQICAPRLPQVALATPGLLESLREDIRETARKLSERHELFRKRLPEGWEVGSQGGYFAFVKTPFRGVSSRVFCEKMVKELGVLALPSVFFREEGKKDADGIPNCKEEEEWIRFSVANVGDEKVREVCERLAVCAPRDAVWWYF